MSRSRWILVALLCAAPTFAHAQDHTADVARIRKPYPARVSPADAERLIADVAATLGAPYGRLKDRGGNHCGAFECDIICRVDTGEHWDVLIDGPDATTHPIYSGKATASWQPKGLVDKTRCETVATPEPTPEPEPEPEPPAPACDLTELNARLDLIMDAIGKIQAAEDAQAQQAQLQGQKLDSAISQAEAIIAELQKGVKSKPDRLTQIVSGLATLFAVLGAAK